MWLWVVSLPKIKPLVEPNILTWYIPSSEHCMTWSLKLLAQALILPSHQQKPLLMGLLVQSSPRQQRNLPTNPRLPPLLLRLLRFSSRSILFKVLKAWAIIKRRVKIKIKNPETNRRIQDQPIMITIKGREKQNIHFCYAEVTISQKRVPSGRNLPIFEFKSCTRNTHRSFSLSTTTDRPHV